MKKTEAGCRPDQLFGAWAVDPKRFVALVERAKSIDLATLPRAADDIVIDVDEPEPSAVLDYRIEGRVAVFEITGPMTKYQTSFQALFGGTSTVAARAGIRAAVRDKKVGAIMVKFDSPGGTVAGTLELAQAIADADRQKRTYCYIEDLGCSAAYEAASQARKIFANEAAEVGSIGVFAVLEDTSGMYESAGVKVHVVSSAPLKGAGVDGTPVTPELKAEVKRQIDGLAELFVKVVAKGRGMPVDQVRELADGRVHLAKEAKKLGLIDEVTTFEDAMKEARRTMENEEALAKAQADNATLKAQLETVTKELAERKEAETKAKAAADPLADLPPTARALVEASQKDAAEAKAAVAKLQDEQLTKDFEAKVRGFKALGIPVAFAQTLKAIHGWKPEAAAAVEQVLKAADEQCAKGGLFKEEGSNRADETGSAEQRVEARAKVLFGEGKAKDLHAAREMAWKENPELWKQHMQERRAS